MPGTKIAPDAYLGEGSNIIVSGKYRQLHIGARMYMRNFCSILLDTDASLVIGDKVFFNNGCSVNCLHDIEIGAGTSIGEGVKIYDHNHSYHYEQDGTLVLERDQYTYGRVRIGKNCWLGSNVTVLKGVEIGDNVIIGANCLIYKSIPSGSVVKHIENLEISVSKL
ncbi:MAG: acyltransferase [Sphingobacteriales bacterium]|nr:acyltransferase [Sphingobacteriales bacterium]